MTHKDIYKKHFFSIRPDVLICIFLVLAVLAVYLQVRDYEFINFDDSKYVTENDHVLSGLTMEGIKWSFTATHASNWHPLTWISHMVDCELYGLNAGPHHLTNLLFHIINTLLLFVVLRRLTGGMCRSAFVAALFALHPLHVESVAWIAERKDVLSTFFWMLTMWSYVLYVERKNARRYMILVVFFILGLMSKPMVVTLPFVLLLLDYWPLGRVKFEIRSSRSKVKSGKKKVQKVWSVSGLAGVMLEKAPLFLLAGVSGAVTFVAQKAGGAVSTFHALPLYVRAGNALESYTGYLVKMIRPSGLTVFYPHPGELAAWHVSGALALLVTVSLLAVWCVRSQPYLAIGWAWYVGTLVPVIGLVQVGGQSMADRYTYMPLIGIFIMIAWGIPDLVSGWRHRKIVLGAAAGVIICVLMTLTWVQLRYWKDSVSLFRHALDVTVNNDVAHNNLGIALRKHGRASEAIGNFREALRLRPDNPEMMNNLANALVDDGKPGEAIKYYSEALRIRPEEAFVHFNMATALEAQGKFDEAVKRYLVAAQIKPDLAKAHSRLGVVLHRLGRLEESIGHFFEVVRISPDDAGAHNNLGNVLLQKGEYEKAFKEYSEAVRISPDYAKAFYNMGVAAEKQGKAGEAVKYFSEAVRITPDFAEAHNDLGIVLKRQGNLDEAIHHYREAIRIKPDFAEAHNTIGNALVAVGEFDEAMKYYVETMRLDPGFSAVVCYNIACMYSIKGNIQESVDWLRKALESGYNRWDLIRKDRDLDNIRSSSYYKETCMKQPEE